MRAGLILDKVNFVWKKIEMDRVYGYRKVDGRLLKGIGGRKAAGSKVAGSCIYLERHGLGGVLIDCVYSLGLTQGSVACLSLPSECSLAAYYDTEQTFRLKQGLSGKFSGGDLSTVCIYATPITKGKEA